jgi:hypothetical protein
VPTTDDPRGEFEATLAPTFALPPLDALTAALAVGASGRPHNDRT